MLWKFRVKRFCTSCTLTIYLRCLLDFMAAREETSHAKYFKPPLTQEEKLLKREKRKQYNRESASRSRLRKQVELEYLQVSVETLTNENNLLKDELKRLSGECDKLASENISLKGELSKHLGPEKVPEDNNDNDDDDHDGDDYLQSSGDKGNN